MAGGMLEEAMRVGIYFGLIAGMVIGGWLGFGLELLGLASFSAGMVAYEIFRAARSAINLIRGDE